MTTRRALTDTFIKNVRPNGQTQYFTDAGRKGLMLVVSPTGEKKFVIRYQRDNKPDKLTVGSWSDGYTLAEAHAAHVELRRQLTDGLDPKAERERRAKECEAEQKLQEEAANVPTIEARYSEWFALITARRKRPDDVANKLGRNMLPKWRTRDPRTITKKEAKALFQEIVDRDAPAMANDVFQQCKQFFSWMADEDYIDANPITMKEPPGGAEYARDRWLRAEELRAVFIAYCNPATRMSRRIRLALLLILVTGQRPGEVLNMRHDELDLEKRVWRIPGDVVMRRRSERTGRKRNVLAWGKTKNGLAHVVPLTSLAVAIINALHEDVIDQYGELKPYVVAAFKDERKDYPVDEKALARALRNNIITNENSNHETLFGLEPFTPHDKRRTATTHLSSLGVLPHIKSRILNHAEEEDTNDKSLKVYDCWEYIDEKRAALEQWAGALLPIFDCKSPAEVVSRVADRKRHEQKGIPKPRRCALAAAV